MKIFKNAEEIREHFLKKGWASDTIFEEITLKLAKEKNWWDIVKGIMNGHKYFMMNVTGNIYDERGFLFVLNLSYSPEKNVIKFKYHDEFYTEEELEKVYPLVIMDCLEEGDYDDIMTYSDFIKYPENYLEAKLFNPNGEMCDE